MSWNLYPNHVCFYLFRYNRIGNHTYKSSLFEYVKISLEKGEVTANALAISKSQLLRTTIPMGIVKQFGLRDKQRLNWTIQINDNKMVIMVSPEVE